mgnify:CR=1 FL=1
METGNSYPYEEYSTKLKPDQIKTDFGFNLKLPPEVR